MTRVRFEVRGAVRDLFRSTDREVLLSGAAGTGKTYGALMRMHLHALRTPRYRGLLLRKTHASLTASTLVTFRQKAIAEALAVGAVRWYGGSAQEPPAFRYQSGATITVGGLDRSTRLLSTEYDEVLVDEAIETTAEDLDTIVTRLRNGALPIQQLVMLTNPGAPTHHLKQRVDAGRTRILYSQHEDNPRLYRGGQWTEFGQQYLATLDSLTGVRYQRMRHGLWVAAEGLIYEDWRDAVHLVDRFDVPEAWPCFWSVDFGYTNPMVIQIWREDPDGRAFLTQEIYRTRRTVDQHARDVLRMVSKKGVWNQPKPRAIICDHDAEGRAVLERELGMSTRAADKRVKIGIEAVQRRLRDAGDGRPRLFIMRDTVIARDHALVEAKLPTCTVEEMASYRWDLRQGKDQSPVKEDDHGADALRYYVLHRDPPSGRKGKILLPHTLGALR